MTKYKIDFSKGLVPAILQDNQTKQVLMLGYMNQEAFDKTIGLIIKIFNVIQQKITMLILAM
ncbi:TPA: hypothetical protein SGP63_001632 [Staphylococcus aureus]|nr:hypothetical protein [Staphylococcus aureus]